MVMVLCTSEHCKVIKGNEMTTLRHQRQKQVLVSKANFVLVSCALRLTFLDRFLHPIRHDIFSLKNSFEMILHNQQQPNNNKRGYLNHFDFLKETVVAVRYSMQIKSYKKAVYI